MAFASNFTPAFKRPAPTRAVCERRTSPTAVLGVRQTTQYGAQTSTYTVKVIEGNNKETTIEVDRDTDLRKALLANKIDVYTLKGKLTNCGGGGQCGTCLISVEEGYTNGRTPREEHLLESKPANWRLACRTLISGDVTIRTKPQ